MPFGLGLTPVSTDDLRKLLLAVHRQDLSYPLSVSELARVGLQHRTEELLHQLRGLDEPAVRAVVSAVLSERLQLGKR